ADILQRQALGDQFGGIDLDPDRRLLLATDRDLGDAGNLADLLGELRVDRVADRGQRQGVRGRRQQQDRRVRRIDLAIGRRRGEVLRQLSAGGVDRALHVIGGAIDAAVEVELDGDGRGSEITGRGHLGDAGDLGELSLQRLRYRGGHGFRAAARQGRGDLDGREVDLGQRRDGKQWIGNETDEQDAGHHQRRADGVTNEGCGNPVAHSGRTLDGAGSELATAVVTDVPGETLYWPAVITC